MIATPRTRFRVLIVPLALVVSGLAGAQAPPGYYDTVDTATAANLRATLHAIIDDHTRFPYTSSSTDTWDILEMASEDPNNASNILDVYRNESFAKEGGGNSFYNREHTWPKSYGFPDDSSTNYTYADCHQLFLCDSGYNSSRSNKPYRNCSPSCSEKTTVFNFGQGGGSGVYPGNSNWTSGSFTQGTWETWAGRRGDVARAVMYVDVRYEGGIHGVTNAPEPDLILTDTESLIENSNTGQNESVAYMGMLSVILQWHQEDPPDSLEMIRNDVVFSFQGNRNPFVDHPEWADCLYGGACGGGDATPPAAPTGLIAIGGDSAVDLNWSDNLEPDVAGYDVLRSSVSGGPYVRLNANLLTTSLYSDASAVNGMTYYFVVTASDFSANESAASAEVFATPQAGGGPPPGDPWINEFHYDNAGADTGEFIEIAGPAGLNLSGWTLYGYNGNGGSTYNFIDLSGLIPDQQNCVGTLSFSFTGLQNGTPDGMALVSPLSVVVEFLSYEGTLTATGGPASGMTSVDVGVSESFTTPIGFSLQRGGTGGAAAAFTWQSELAATPGQPNTGQTLDGCTAGPPAAPTGLLAIGNDGEVGLVWNANSEPDLDGYNVHRSIVSGGPYSQVNGALVTGTAYDDSAVVNATTYFYVVTAVNLSGMESAVSAESEATPADMTAPAAPILLMALASDGQVALDWADNTELDLLGYDIHRSTTSGGPYQKLNSLALATSDYLDQGLLHGTTYFYVVSASDLAGNDSPFSLQVEATPLDTTPPLAPRRLPPSTPVIVW